MGELPYLMYHVALEFGRWTLARGLQLFHHLLPIASQAKLVVWNDMEELSYVLYQITLPFVEWTISTLTFLSCGVAQHLLSALHGSLIMAWQFLYQAVTSVILMIQHVGNHLLSAVHGLLLVVWHFSSQLLCFAYEAGSVFGEWTCSRLIHLVYNGVEWLNHIHPVLLIRDATLAMWQVLRELSYLVYQVALVLINWTCYCGVQLLSSVHGTALWILGNELPCLVYQSVITFGKWIHSNSIFLVNGIVQLFGQLLSSIYGALLLIWQGLEEVPSTIVLLLQTHPHNIMSYIRGELLLALVIILIIIVTCTSLIWLRRRRQAVNTVSIQFATLRPAIERRRRQAVNTVSIQFATLRPAIERKFRRRWAPQKGACPNIKFIFIIRNTKLKQKWMRYQQSLKDQTVEEHYHGTNLTCDIATSQDLCNDKSCGICGISRNGFDLHCVRKNIKFQRFGHGFYLAPNSSKCHDYTRRNCSCRAMLLCHVCPGNKYYLKENSVKLRSPPDGFDSVYGETGGILNYEEIVLYNPDAILPLYIIVYDPL